MDKTTTYLTFTLGEEVFAVDVANVREVLELPAITRVPRTPAYMLGVINLRGNVVPVVDMRLKFGLPAPEHTKNTCIVVLEVAAEEERLVIGALADSVREVFELPEGQIEPPPRLGTRLDIDFVRGMARHDDRFTIVLDIDRIFSVEEIALVGSVAAEGNTGGEPRSGGRRAGGGTTRRRKGSGEG